MVLVVFNYNAALDGDTKLDHYAQTLPLPRWAHDKRWTLVGVNAMYLHDDKEDFKHLDVEFPELMTTETVLYANKSMGNVSVPENGFRFYAKSNAMSHVAESNAQVSGGLYRARPVFGCVSEYPNWDLGSHRLESETLSIVVSAREGNVSTTTPCRLNSFSIILSFD